MDLIKFSVATTNVFPMANSSHGGQLTTEWNLRSRESVGTHSSVKYIIGPSYTHSMEDFEVILLHDDSTESTSTVLQISEGRAVVNGHYIESLVPISLDMGEINTYLRKQNLKPLKGKLSIGLRVMYSTEYTMAGSISAENDEDMYEGIHIVILPVDDFKLPEDVPYNQEKVTAHLKLADVTFSNGSFSTLKQNKSKVCVLDMDKIGDINKTLDNYYVTKYGLNPGNLYVMSGKGMKDGNGVESWWCNATDSLMRWTSRLESATNNPDVYTNYPSFDIVPANYDEEIWNSESRRLEQDDVVLRVPHKQVDGYVDSGGSPLYYKDVMIPLPNANFDYKSPGIVTTKMLNRLHSINDKIDTYYRLPAGKMRQYIPVLSDRADLPPIPLARNLTNTYFIYKVKTEEETWNNVAELFSVSAYNLMDINGRDYSEQDASEPIGKDAEIKIPIYHNNYNKLSYNVSNLQAKVTDLISKYNEFYQSFETRVLDVMQSNISVAVKSQVQTSTNELSTSISNIETTVSSINSDLASITSRVTSINDSIISINSDITALQSQLQSHIDGQTNQPSSETDQNAKINKLVTDVATLNGEVEELQQQLGIGEGNNSGVIQRLEEFINGSGGEFETLKNDVELLKTMFNNFSDSYQEYVEQANAAITQAMILAEARLRSDYNAYTDMKLSDIEERLDSRVDMIVERMKTEYNFIDGWKAGDYVLVGQDMTLGVNSDGRYPTTAYVVVPGYISVNEFNPNEDGTALKYVGSITLSAAFPITISSNAPQSWDDKKKSMELSEAYDTYYDSINIIKRTVPAALTWGAELDSYELAEGDGHNENNALNYWDVTAYRGTPNLDYFVARSKKVYEPSESQEETFYDATGNKLKDYIDYRIETYTSYFYTPVYNSTDLEYDSEPLMITGGVPLASETEVGGFLNVPATAIGNGYIYRDDDGHLRLADYDILSSGTYAYQLGEDRSEGSGLSIEEIQNIFNEYINYRIAFPNAKKLSQSIESETYEIDDSSVIHITLTLNNEQSGILNIFNIDSRFGTVVYLDIIGECSNDVVINISNCQRMRIHIGDDINAVINLDNVELWYDADVLDKVSDIRSLKLWYQKLEFSNPNYEVDGMTVTNLSPTQTAQASDFYSPFDSNDNHFAFGIKSMTFSSTGDIIGIQVIATDNVTATTNDGQSIFYTRFALPQNAQFQFPEKRLTRKLKITGEFITAYREYIDKEWVLKNTNFSIVTNQYSEEYDETNLGDISILTNVYSISSFTGNIGDASDTEGWRGGSWHIFSGGVTN